jgi:hypothetical protein
MAAAPLPETSPHYEIWRAGSPSLDAPRIVKGLNLSQQARRGATG